MKYLYVIIPAILVGLGFYYNEPMIYSIPFLGFAILIVSLNARTK